MDEDGKNEDKPKVIGPMSSIRNGSAHPAGDEEPRMAKKPAATGRWDRFKNWYLDNKKTSIPLSVAVLLILIFAVPPSRYAVAGLAVKKDVNIEVKDSITNTPVTGANVSFGNQNAITDANGKATLKSVKPGHLDVLISKKYYKDQELDILVPVVKAAKARSTTLAATGRAVRIKVVDYVDGKALADVNINIADTTGKTDKNGLTTIVVPVGEATQKAKLSLDGYNTKEADIKVSNNSIQETQVKLAQSGKIYFFSKRTGKLDLMKVNLDGSDAQVVLPATGTEDVSHTTILQSPDWNYVALLMRRSSADETPQLYVLKTDDDKLISVDTGKAHFSIEGWAGDKLIYTSTRTDLPAWQAGASKLKSYDAGSGKITLLDQQQAGDSTINLREIYGNVFVSADKVVFYKYWYSSGTTDKQNTIQMIDADGQNHKTIASYDTNKTSEQITLHTPTSFYLAVNDLTTYKPTYYEFSFNSPNPHEVNINTSQFYEQNTGYYPSPSGKQLLWSEPRDGKNTLLIGDQTGGNPAIIGAYQNYLPFGWLTDKYIILSKNNSELYIMGAKGGTPLKVTDFQATSYYYD